MPNPRPRFLILAMIATAGSVPSASHAEESIPAEIDAARKSAYRAVQSLEKHMDDKDQYVRKECGSWKLSKADALQFLSQADAIDPVQLHHGYYSVACGYRGTFTADGQVYEFTINGGLHGILRDVRSDAVYLLGCNDKCRKLSPFDFYDSDDD